MRMPKNVTETTQEQKAENLAAFQAKLDEACASARAKLDAARPHLIARRAAFNEKLRGKTA